MYNDTHRKRFVGIPLASSARYVGDASAIKALDANGNFEFTWAHNHSDFEIILIKSGCGVFTIDGISKKFSSGNMIAVNPYELHSTSVFINTLPLSYYCITFDLSILGGVMGLASELEDGIKKCKNLFSPSDSKQLFFYMNELEGVFESRCAGWELTVSGLVHNIFGEFCRLGAVYSCEANGKKRQFVRNTQMYIEKNYTSQITSLDAARALAYDNSYFCRLFKKNYGQSFGDYVNLYRINVAKSALTEGKSVTDTARLSGFSEVSYFTKIFKKYTAMTPTQWKSENLERM